MRRYRYDDETFDRRGLLHDRDRRNVPMFAMDSVQRSASLWIRRNVGIPCASSAMQLDDDVHCNNQLHSSIRGPHTLERTLLLWTFRSSNPITQAS